MIGVRLESETDFAGWRRVSRRLCTRGFLPDRIEWRVGNGPTGLFGDEARRSTTSGPAGTPPTAPRRFVEQAERVICHRDPERFARLYRLLWRLQKRPKLLEIASDRDVAWLHKCDKAIKRDRHKMHAFVRFRKVGEEAGRERFAAWFEPEHRIVELAAPFFMRRFPNMDWAILTPERSAIWDGMALRFADGARREDAPHADVVEDQWRTYFSSIFNPARLKVKAMTAEMPKKYWKNLPEAECIAGLIADAERRTGVMREEAVSEPSELSRRLARRQNG